MNRADIDRFKEQNFTMIKSVMEYLCVGNDTVDMEHIKTISIVCKNFAETLKILNEIK